MERYAMYLRKSRADEEAEARGEGESLARHRAALLETARRMGIVVTEIYEEIVSGDSIDARPMMQRLLSEVESKQWSGVLVMDVDRLARGNTIDQGIVAQAFKFSSTKIITPSKVYDTNNEYDEEYFEFGLFMARREYKMITRRMQRGRLASVMEGKFCGNYTPYGYVKVKLPGEKGYTLDPDEHADTVRNIYAWYVSGELGVNLIVRRLNETGVPSPTGRDWTNCVIRGILSNPTYAGKIRWDYRGNVSQMRDGEVVTSRPRNLDCTVVPGRHEALISEDDYVAAQKRLADNKSRPGPKQMACKNPLAGLIYCADCGRAMVRRPYSRNYPDGLLCPYTSCHNVSSTLDAVEAAILDGLLRLMQQSSAPPLPPSSPRSAPVDVRHLRAAIAAADKELAATEAQIKRAYELVEQGIYTPEQFLERSRDLSARKATIEQQRATLQAELDRQTQEDAQRAQLAPRIKQVLDAYPLAESAAEKNELLKSVISRVVYKKTVRERWSPGGSDMTLTITPRFF